MVNPIPKKLLRKRTAVAVPGNELQPVFSSMAGINLASYSRRFKRWERKDQLAKEVLHLALLLQEVGRDPYGNGEQANVVREAWKNAVLSTKTSYPSLDPNLWA